MFKDYYSILEVPDTSNIDEIKKAYKKQAIKWHPDKPQSSDTTQRMQDINEAYDILSNPVKRAHYDIEYLRFQKYQEPREKSANEHQATDEYEVQDELLKDWISKARKQAMQDLKGIAYAGAKGGTHGVMIQIIGILIVLTVVAVGKVYYSP